MAKLSQIKLGSTTYDIGAAWGNISGKPSSFPPESHTHSYLPLSGGTLTGRLKFAAGDAMPNFNSPTVVATYVNNDSAQGLGYASTSTLKVGAANMLNNHGNSSVAISTAIWQHNPWSISSPKYVWGQAFQDTSVSSDTGNITIVCGANSTAGGYAAHLCVDGGIATLGNIYSGKTYGAVWNDYAEFRTQKEEIKPGYCVASADNGTVYKTTEKFQACDGIVSDTFGFAIGETDECKTPLAVAGRVLAYCEGDRHNYHSGDTVCAGPEGKVCKMTREEIKEWPDRIIGIVSEIPEYETWGTGNIAVDGRIWIKVK